MTRRAELAAIAALIAVAALALGQSWMRWPDPIIDVGRDLYIPEQIREGTKLYRDVLYFYPPLTPYLLAALTAVTGSSLAGYTVIGILIAACTALVLYLLVRHVGGAMAAFAATLLFVACTLAGASTYGCNYIFPYAHAMTLAMLFYLGFVAALSRERPALAIAFALLSPWTKIDFIPAIALLLVGAVIVRRMRARWLVAYGIAACASIALVSAYFGFDDLRANVLAPSLLSGPAARMFYARVSGMADLGENLTAVVIGAAAIVAMIWLLRTKRIVALIVFCAIALSIGDHFFRAWTLLQLVLLPFALRRPREPLLLLLVASLGATARVFFTIAPEWYGFVFCVPLYALIAYVLFAWLPARGVYGPRIAAMWLVPIVIISAASLHQQWLRWSLKEHAIHTQRGTFYDHNEERATALNAFLRDVRQMDSLVVMPEGLTLNYFANVENPTRYHTFTPAETFDAATERAIIAELAAKRPECIAIVSRDVREFGSRGFGVDYDRALLAWVRANYRVHAVARSPRFQLVVLRR